jgi:hypothetical protein
MREGSQQQRQTACATVREERADTAGDEEPPWKSLVSIFPQRRKRDQGDDAEFGRPSTISREAMTSGAEGATERS